MKSFRPRSTGERLDRIVALIADVSRSDAAALIAAGGALVDGVVAQSGKVRLSRDSRSRVDPTLLPDRSAAGRRSDRSTFGDRPRRRRR